MVVQWPAQIKEASIQHAACHVVDILPTILQAAGASYPTEYNHHEIQPLDGESLLSYLKRTITGNGNSRFFGSMKGIVPFAWVSLSWCENLTGRGNFMIWK